MADDPNRYAALDDSKDWNMGPFYVLVNGNTGQVVCEEDGAIHLYRAARVGPVFVENHRRQGRVVRYATLQLVGGEVLR